MGKLHDELLKSGYSGHTLEVFKTELERLEFLFALYRQYTEPLSAAMDGKLKRRKK